jgi:hypothetical protein
MNLDEAQRKRVATWIGDGLKLSEIQSRISSEFGVSLTYMEVRLLVDDLKLVPKDIERNKPVVVGGKQAAQGSASTPFSEAIPARPGEESPQPEEPAAGAGGVSITVDTVARPGAVVSGSVKFSDGKAASWHLDQLGRLGLVTSEQGYRPSAADMQEFQAALERELARLGF